MEGAWKQTALFLPVLLLTTTAVSEENVIRHLEQVKEEVANNSITAVPPGGVAKLSCPIPAEMFGTRVSWIRRKDLRLLSVGEDIYINDERLLVTHSKEPQDNDSLRHSQVWFLHLKNVTLDDEGNYECQTSTYPHVSFFIFLRVQKTYSTVQGPKERVVAAGSDLQLVCTFRNMTSIPEYVFWYQEERMVNYDVNRGIHVTSDAKDNSILKVSSATEDHGGNYTCAPADVVPSSVVVHVIPETTDPGGKNGQKRGVKTPVRQLGVKSASSAWQRHPSHLQQAITSITIHLWTSSSLYLTFSGNTR